MANVKPTTLYHYCSLASFLSIISSKSIWLSDISKSNDSKELTWMREQYYRYIYERYISLPEDNAREIYYSILQVAYEEGYCFGSDMPTAPFNIQRTISSMCKNTRAFVFCLSRLDDPLGQWRGYADDGTGVSIGFNYDYLKSIEGRYLFCPISNLYISKITYELEDLYTLFDDLSKVLNIDSFNHDKTEYVTSNISDLCRLAAFFKNPSFKEEEEWRVAYQMSDNNINSSMLQFSDFKTAESKEYSNKFETPKIGFMSKRDVIISHIEIGIKDYKNAINKVTIGPKSLVTENDIKQILIANGMLENIYDESIVIDKSKSSYR